MLKEADRIRELICAGLNALGVSTSIVGTDIHLQDWPTTLVLVGHAEQMGALIHADIWIFLNEQRADSAIYSCAVGVGQGKDHALKDAVQHRMQGVAPPILSLLYREPKFGAEFCPSGSADGFDGWDSFSGPYVLRGEKELVAETVAILARRRLIDSVRGMISTRLNSTALVQSVSLYVAYAAGKRYSEVRIGGLEDRNISAVLKGIPLMQVQRDFISIRQFFLCMQAVPPNADGNSCA